VADDPREFSKYPMLRESRKTTSGRKSVSVATRMARDAFHMGGIQLIVAQEGPIYPVADPCRDGAAMAANAFARQPCRAWPW
jgi:hypothetical protein